LSWAFYNIFTHPHVEQKILDELDEVLGKVTDSDLDRDIPELVSLGNARSSTPGLERVDIVDDMDNVEEKFDEHIYPAWEHVRKLKYLEAALQESLRLYPPVPTIIRELDEDITIDNYVICKGTNIFLHPRVIHRQPDIWENPNEFNPERFYSPTKEHGPFDFIPFSAGPRNCIGEKFALMEEKMTVAVLVRHFRMELIDPASSVEVEPSLVMKVKGELRMRIVPRRNGN